MALIVGGRVRVRGFTNYMANRNLASSCLEAGETRATQALKTQNQEVSLSDGEIKQSRVLGHVLLQSRIWAQELGLGDFTYTGWIWGLRRMALRA